MVYLLWVVSWVEGVELLLLLLLLPLLGQELERGQGQEVEWELVQELERELQQVQQV